MKTALVTGASSGFGEAIAEMLSKHNYNLILTARRGDRLSALKSKIEAESDVQVHTLVFDIQSNAETEKAFNSLPVKFQSIDLLVNNAGLAAGMDTFDTGKIEDWDAMIDTNVKGLLYISRLVTPWMVERKSGQIINIGSIAGRQVYPKGNVYCATKFAVEALTQAMRIDLLPHGIKVSSVSPGSAETEFSLVRFGDADKAKAVYNGYKPLNANDISEAVEFIITRPAHVNIGDILITPGTRRYDELV